jgi:hypothetical protein
VLSAYGLVSYLMARTKRDAKRTIAILGLAAAMMTLTRPQGAFLVPVLFGLAAALAWRRAWIALTAAVLVYGAVWSAQAVDQRIRSDAHSPAGSLDTGKALLFSVFRRSQGQYPHPPRKWTEERRTQGSLIGRTG